MTREDFALLFLMLLWRTLARKGVTWRMNERSEIETSLAKNIDSSRHDSKNYFSFQM